MLPTDPFAIEQESINNTKNTIKKIRHLTDPAPLRPSKEFLALYKSLTKRFHPDIATEEETRAQRTATMSRINQAFVMQDMGALKRCNQKQETPPKTEQKSDLVKLVRRIARLRSLCKGAEERQKEQEKDPLVELLLVIQKNAQEQENPFSEIHEMLEELIDTKKFFWLNQQMRSAQLLTEVDP